MTINGPLMAQSYEHNESSQKNVVAPRPLERLSAMRSIQKQLQTVITITNINITIDFIQSFNGVGVARGLGRPKGAKQSWPRPGCTEASRGPQRFGRWYVEVNLDWGSDLPKLETNE